MDFSRKASIKTLPLFHKVSGFFECQCELWSEDRFETLSNSSTTSQAEPSASGSLMKKDLAAFGDPLDTTEELRLRRYSSIVEEYCDKQLTFSMDILDAFAGIGAVMAQLCSWNMVSGLPKELLDRALLWEQGNHTSVRVSNSTSENRKFPTWSWAAWTGDVQYNTFTASELLVFHSPFRIGMDIRHEIV
jgi:hypothetical protein